MGIHALRIPRTAIAGLGIVAALGLATAVWARPGHGGPGLEGLEHRVARLDLSSDTRTKVYAAIDAARPAQRSLRSQLFQAHERMRALLEGGNVDEAAVMAAADEIGKLETDLRKSNLQTLLKVRSLLPADQRALLTERGCRGGPGRGPGRGPGPGR